MGKENRQDCVLNKQQAYFPSPSSIKNSRKDVSMRRFTIFLFVVLSLGAKAAGQQPAVNLPLQDSLIAEIMKTIAGKENEPAETVFKNIQTFKGIPAGRLLRIMKMGWARSLGVDCSHCHVIGQWASDEKPEKGIAREMSKMLGTINRDLLGAIKNLKSREPRISCSTCHRGQTKPE
jgi:hypothetical protein